MDTYRNLQGRYDGRSKQVEIKNTDNNNNKIKIIQLGHFGMFPNSSKRNNYMSNLSKPKYEIVIKSTDKRKIGKYWSKHHMIDEELEQLKDVQFG